MKGEISQKVLAVIKKEKIKMKPACYFWLCSGFWLILATVFFFLSVFWAGAFFHQLSVLKGLYFLDKNLYLFFLSFPYLPLFLLLIFVTLAVMAYRKGRMVCHHENWLLFFLLSLAGFSSGALWLEWSRQSDNAGLFFRQGQVLKYVILSPDQFWSMPEKGTLKGEFISFDPKTEKLLIFSSTGEEWIVETKGCPCSQKIPNRKGTFLQIFGLQKSVKDKVFHAQQIWLAE